LPAGSKRFVDPSGNAPVSAETQPSDDDFQKELVELFRQEAQEWLVQIDAALTELEGQASPDRHIQLVEAIVRAITSLGGSAATINLPEVERVTFALLPFMEIVRDRTTASKQDYFTVRQQFRVVTASVREATGLIFGAVPPAEEATSVTPGIELLTLLNSLRELPDTCVRTRSWTRHLIQNVIRRLEQTARQGAERIEAGVLQEMLGELVGADEEFFQDLQRTLPDIRQAMDILKARPSCKPLPSDDFMSSLSEVERLQGRAKQVNAAAIATFLTGLQNFISLLAHRRLGLGTKKLDAVGARITSVLEVTHEWVQSGREEREAIIKALPNGT
jgi:hypothetical protein